MTHEPLIMTGEAALGRGAWDAGISLAAGYPGSPATHVLTTVMQLAQDQPAMCHVEWSVNERVALDLALGVSLTGHRALVVTKSVGFNTIIPGAAPQGGFSRHNQWFMGHTRPFRCPSAQ